MEYNDSRRLFHVMKLSGWRHDAKTGGFIKRVDGHRLWLSWGQAAEALNAADTGAKWRPEVSESETMAQVIQKASNDDAR